MPTVCIQCALKALVAGDDVPPPFDETPQEHLARVHPDPDATKRERVELESQLLQLAPEALARWSRDKGRT